MFLLIFFLPLATSIQWLQEVSGYNEKDSIKGYSGKFGVPITAIRIDGNLPYRVHIKDSNWLPPVTGNSQNISQKDYAGNGKIIDCISVKGAKYKVHILNGDWTPEISKYNIYDIDFGIAGIYGKPIDAIMINGRKYQVGINENNNINDDFYNDINCNEVYYKCDNQEFIKCGTGLKNVDYQWNIEGMQFACTFLSCCVIGGLGNMTQFIEARDWALQEKYIDDVTTHVNIDYLKLAKLISEKFNTTFHDKWTIYDESFHHFVRNENGTEIFNAAGLGVE